MEHKIVKSSMISSVGYDPDLKKMEVKFKDNSVYEYHNVKEHTHKRFMNAKSLGSHLSEHITPHHRYNKKIKA